MVHDASHELSGRRSLRRWEGGCLVVGGTRGRDDVDVKGSCLDCGRSLGGDPRVVVDPPKRGRLGVFHSSSPLRQWFPRRNVLSLPVTAPLV